MKKVFLPIIVLTLLLATATIIHAQTTSPSVSTSPSISSSETTGTNVQSDFGKDLQDGEQAIANDKEAKQNQKDEKDSENVGIDEQGEVQNQQGNIDEQDLNESEDDVNQEGDNRVGSMQEKSNADGEKKDDVNSGRSNSAPTGTQQNTNNTQEDKNTNR